MLFRSVGVCSRFQSNPKVSHLNAVKRIIKYVGGTCDYGLFYSKESNLSLVGFSDSDWASNVDDIVFGATNDSLAHSFADEMKAMFEMSMVGELTYFLGLQVK